MSERHCCTAMRQAAASQLVRARGRHVGLSLWFGSQTFRSIGVACRRQTHAYFLGKFTNAAETEAFSTELSSLAGSKEGVVALYRAAMKLAPHSILYIEVRNEKFYNSNWEELTLDNENGESDEEE